MEDQDTQIVKLTDRMKSMMEEESNHAPEKRLQTQEMINPPTKKV